MQDKFSEELLSAYLDGEASPQECAEVERMLESSPELRQKLEDFRQLSELMAEQPKQTVPPEFCSEVMHAAERRMLLPETKPVAAKLTVRAQILIITGVLTAAAVLVISVQFINLQNGPAAPAIALRESASATSQASQSPAASSAADGVEVAQSDETALDAPVSEFRNATGGSALERSESGSVLAAKAGDISDAKVSGKPGAAAFGGKDGQQKMVVSNRMSGAVHSKAKGAAIAEKTPAAAALAKQQNESAATAAAPPVVANLKSVERKAIPDKKDIQWDEVVVGQVIDAVDTSGEKIAIVKIYVIDRAAGLHAIQVALAESEVPAIDVSEQQTKRKEADLLKRDGQPERMEALYVEATTEQLAKALQNLRNDKSVLDGRMAPAIELARLDPDSQKLVAQNNSVRQLADQEAQLPKKGATTAPTEAKRDSAKEGKGSSAARLRGTSEVEKTPPGASVARRAVPVAPAAPEGAKSSAAAQPSVKSSDSKGEQNKKTEESSKVANNARQLLVNIPANALQNGVPASDKDAADRAHLKNDAVRESEVADKKVANNAPALRQYRGQRNAAMPVQVIFVLEQQPKADLPAAPPAKPIPDGGAA